MIKPLTSLRFIFALMVFFSHVGTTDNSLFYMTLQKKVFHEGLVGVTFFFMLSGFVLALNYTTKLNKKEISNKEFWIARFARIYPLHLITLFIAIPLSIKVLLSAPVLWAINLVLHLFLLQSFIPNREVYFSFNSPAWSISDEMFFYAMFPFIIAGYFKFPKFNYLVISIMLLIPVGIWLCPDNLQHEIFYANPIFRIVDFTIGIILYKLYKSEKIKRFFNEPITATCFEIFAIGTFALFIYFNASISQGYRYSCYYWLPVVAVIITFSYQSGYLSYMLSNKVMILLGEISFSFYLLHQLVLRYLEAINKMFPIFTNFYFFITLVFSITLVASYISYKYIELPINRYIKSRLKSIKLAKVNIKPIDSEW